MIMIRKEQMDHFSKVAEDAFEKKMVEYLQAEFSEELRNLKLDEKALRGFVRQGIDAARKYKVSNAYDVQRYLACGLILGPEFDVSDATSWAGEILRLVDVGGEEKMDRIEHRLFLGLPLSQNHE